MQTQQNHTTSAIIPPLAGEGRLHPKVAALNFERLKWKLAHSEESAMPQETCELAEREYRRFLTLKIAFPKAVLVPTKLMDKFWHAHILDTAAYQRDCMRLFGKFLHHCPYFGVYGNDDKEFMDNAFAETHALYSEFFGEPSPEAEALPARCRSKPCHAPTPCRCR